MWFVVDGCGIVCFIIAYILLGSSNYVVLRNGSWPFGETGQIACPMVYECWFILSIWSHLAAMLTDPGAVPLDIAEELEEKSQACEPPKRCSKCRVIKPPRAHHCSVCKRCILKMDHHCPWVNNCVAARNQKHFVLFLLYVQLQCFAALISLGTRFLTMTAPAPSNTKRFLEKKNPLPNSEVQFGEVYDAVERSTADAPSDGDILACMLLFIVAIIFGLFTFIMSCDQFSNIVSNQTGIDALKGETAKARPWKESLQEVMGRGPSFRWLLPLPVKHDQVKDDS